MVNYPCCVDSNEEDNGDLGLGLYDIHLGNFRNDTISRLFALDFAKTNFLPCALQDLAFVDGHCLAEAERNSLDYSKSKYRGALRLAGRCCWAPAVSQR
jgi:hypothetical protein